MELFDTVYGVIHRKVGIRNTNNETKCTCDSCVKTQDNNYFINRCL